MVKWIPLNFHDYNLQAENMSFQNSIEFQYFKYLSLNSFKIPYIGKMTMWFFLNISLKNILKFSKSCQIFDGEALIQLRSRGTSGLWPCSGFLPFKGPEGSLGPPPMISGIIQNSPKTFVHNSNSFWTNSLKFRGFSQILMWNQTNFFFRTWQPKSWDLIIISQRSW